LTPLGDFRTLDLHAPRRELLATPWPPQRW